MPQLQKRGKWVFGWVRVHPGRKIVIPPDAFCEYGFRTGSTIAFTQGSRRSGGIGIGLMGKMPSRLNTRVFASGKIENNGEVVLPVDPKIKTGDRLLVVRGSGYALGFLAYGPIFELALHYGKLAEF